MKVIPETGFRFLEESITFHFFCIICVILLVLCTEVEILPKKRQKRSKNMKNGPRRGEGGKPKPQTCYKFGREGGGNFSPKLSPYFVFVYLHFLFSFLYLSLFLLIFLDFLIFPFFHRLFCEFFDVFDLLFFSFLGIF